MARQFKQYGIGRDTLVEYKTSEGEKVKVVSGNYNLKIKKKIGRWKVPVVKNSTRVWVDGNLELEVDQKDLPYDEIPILRVRLEELEDVGAPSDEVMASILTVSDQYKYREGMRELEDDYIDRHVEDSGDLGVYFAQNSWEGFQVKKTRRK